MVEGLSINEEKFLSLSKKRQMGVLFNNQVATLKLVQGHKFHQKVHSIILGLVCGGLGILFRLRVS